MNRSYEITFVMPPFGDDPEEIFPLYPLVPDPGQSENPGHYGTIWFGLVPVGITNATFHTLAEITLILVLFSDAASIDLKQLGRDHNLPARMLLVGMPLTIALGIVAANSSVATPNHVTVTACGVV